MLLQQGEVRGYDFNRSVVEFTLLNQGKVILCAISTAAMDDLEGRRDVKADQRVDQFMRLREVIEERASRKFFEEPVQSNAAGASVARREMHYRLFSRRVVENADDLALPYSVRIQVPAQARRGA